VADLWTCEVEAHRHADKAKQMALEQLERLCKDDEEASTIKKEWDEVLQIDAMTH
jgi:hypothetical protein